MKTYESLKVSILGSTGSVGTQAVCVAGEMKVKIGILAAGRNYKLLAEQAKELAPEVLAVSDAETAEKLRELTENKYEIIYGEDALEKAIITCDHDVIVHSIAGLAGTASALAAAKTGARVAMANKEAIIAAGGLIKAELEKELAVRDSIAEALADTSENGIIPQFKKAVQDRQQDKGVAENKKHTAEGVVRFSRRSFEKTVDEIVYSDDNAEFEL